MHMYDKGRNPKCLTHKKIKKEIKKHNQHQKEVKKKKTQQILKNKEK